VDKYPAVLFNYLFCAALPRIAQIFAIGLANKFVRWEIEIYVSLVSTSALENMKIALERMKNVFLQSCDIQTHTSSSHCCWAVYTAG